MISFPTEKGTYVLWLHLPKTTQVSIGKRGTGDFPNGYYAYIGSAFGSGGLNGRLKHHLVPAKKPHWHIDYLKVHATIDEVWTVASDHVYEHEWATQLVNLSGASAPMRGFGSSDCKCIAHLIHFPHKPQILLCEDMQAKMV